MIKSLTVENPKGESLKMVLTDPWKSGLIIESIDGLGPADANINTYELATADGGIYSGARLNMRTITLSLRMLEHPSIEHSRHLTYKFFPIKKKIKLILETDLKTVECEGYVEGNDPTIFSEQEGTIITITCPDPSFYHGFYSSDMFSGVLPLFEFPFENNSVTEKLIEFGELRTFGGATVDYVGDVDTGMELLIHLLGDAKNITIYNTLTREKFAIYTDKIASLSSGAIGSGDDILINTKRGNRSVKLLRNGVYTNIISAIDKDADWFQLTPGDNIFAFTAESGETNIMITITYRTAFGGV